jgi:hypothetical protein
MLYFLLDHFQHNHDPLHFLIHHLNKDIYSLAKPHCYIHVPFPISISQLHSLHISTDMNLLSYRVVKLVCTNWMITYKYHNLTLLFKLTSSNIWCMFVTQRLFRCFILGFLPQQASFGTFKFSFLVGHL